ncbi:MAG TPA: PAS domain-containing protein [Chthoniobacteraceae bacterium]|nr:PAS domain-containing protein [Chthoniobacteraceae bacterium]
MTEHAPLPIATVEGATHIVRYANPAFCRLMDEPAEKLIGKPLSELLPEKDECITLLDRVFRARRAENRKLRHRVSSISPAAKGHGNRSPN